MKDPTSSTAATDPMPPYRDEDVRDYALVDEETAVDARTTPSPADRQQHPVDAAIDHALSMARGRPTVSTTAETELHATLQDQPPTLQAHTDAAVNRDSGRASQLASGLEAVALALRSWRQEYVADREARELQAAEHRDLRTRHERLTETVNKHGVQLAGIADTRTATYVGVALVVVVLALCLVMVGLELSR